VNRAMGFGVAAGGVLTGLVAVPPSASAHDTPGHLSPQGQVDVSADHKWVFAWDYALGDGIQVGSQVTLENGSKANMTPPEGQSREVTYGLDIVAYRKCQRIISTGAIHCSEWMVS
jgi:hypothetical protein